MSILNEDVLTSAISDEIESEIETDATASARDTVITVAKFDATPQPVRERPTGIPEREDEPDEEQGETPCEPGPDGDSGDSDSGRR
jgi:hypothetical protein